MMDEFDVAVVVFCRAEGVDEHDASSRAEAAVAQTMRDTGLVGPKLPGQLTKAVAVVPLDQAVTAGYLAARPNARAYKMAGLDAPQKAVQD